MLCTNFLSEGHAVLCSRNFNPGFTIGSMNLESWLLRTTQPQICTSEQWCFTQRASHMMYVTELYVPIAKALSMLNVDSAVKVKQKIDITYLICKEQLVFTKMATLYKSEKKHRVELGSVGLQTRKILCHIVGLMIFFEGFKFREFCKCNNHLRKLNVQIFVFLTWSLALNTWCRQFAKKIREIDFPFHLRNLNPLKNMAYTIKNWV